MREIIILIIGGIIGGLITYELWFSPKAMIEKLWKEVFKFSHEIGKLKKLNEEVGWRINIGAWQKQIDKREKLINALLEYYFDPEEDEEYISENRP